MDFLNPEFARFNSLYTTGANLKLAKPVSGSPMMGPKGFSSTFSLLSSFAKKSLTKRKLKRDFVSQNPRLKSLDDEKVVLNPRPTASLGYA